MEKRKKRLVARGEICLEEEEIGLCMSVWRSENMLSLNSDFGSNFFFRNTIETILARDTHVTINWDLKWNSLLGLLDVHGNTAIHSWIFITFIKDQFCSLIHVDRIITPYLTFRVNFLTTQKWLGCSFFCCFFFSDYTSYYQTTSTVWRWDKKGRGDRYFYKLKKTKELLQLQINEKPAK